MTEHWSRVLTAVLLRAAIQQEWYDLFVEQDFVVELLVIFEKLFHLGHSVLELEHESMALLVTVAIAYRNRPVQYGRRELILPVVLAVQRERHEPTTGSKHSGFDHFSDRRRCCCRVSHRQCLVNQYACKTQRYGFNVVMWKSVDQV